jgi:NADPH2:quinone reductase
VSEGGRLVLAGYHQDGPRTVDLQSWNWRGIDVVNAHERDARVCLDGMRAAADLLASGDLELAPLLSHRFPLARIADAFAAAASRPPGFVKAWVEP